MSGARFDSRSLAGKVSTVEFSERGVEIVWIEQRTPHDPIIKVGFDDGEHLTVELTET